MVSKEALDASPAGRARVQAETWKVGEIPFSISIHTEKEFRIHAPHGQNRRPQIKSNWNMVEHDIYEISTSDRKLSTVA